MIVFVERDSDKAFEFANEIGLADMLINAQLMSDEPDGVLTLIADDPLDKLNYLVVQLFYGHEKEENNGWLVSQWRGHKAPDEIAAFIESTMEEPKLVEVITTNEYLM